MSTYISDIKHSHVLETCIDAPEEHPSFPIPLPRVGITGKTVWVSLADNRGGRIPFTARIFIDLPADRRGIHMSRIEQAVTGLHDMEFSSLPEYGKLLASRVLETQRGENVQLELSGQLPLVRKGAVSRLNSVDSIDICFSIKHAGNQEEYPENFQLGVGVYHLTACPCTLSYNRTLFSRTNDPCPPATHSQRSKTELLVSVTAYEMLPGYNILLNILDKALHISQDLLKRPDETELVLKAHRNPQFAEDTVRETARAAGEVLQDVLPPETKISIKTLSLESIHIHDVECCLETRLADILAISAGNGKEQTT